MYVSDVDDCWAWCWAPKGCPRLLQDLEAQRARTREVAYNLNQRVRQELAFPAVIHLYTWLLQSAKSLLPAKILYMTIWETG